jgi:ATP-binding cassette subfamily F protein 3
MISINSVTVSFTGRDLFNDISFIINPKDRIGLIGKNGVGKSTLLKVIMGIQPIDKGSIAISGGKTIGYLPQEIKVDSDKSIFDEAMTAFQHVLELEQEIEQINIELAERTDYESEAYHKLISDLTEKHERLNVLGSAKAESEVEKVLKGLGFSPDEFEKPINTFSGGWQMRVELAKLLIQQPSLLLLDEPTNHLDIEAILWLEEFFKSYPGALMMISHDRMFLDQVTNRTIEIVFGKIYDYSVPYTKYLTLREERFEQQMATLRNQQKYVAEQEKFIERFRSKATKAKQVQSRIKALEKVNMQQLDELDQSSIQFRFPPAPRSGDVVLKGEQVSKAYEDKEVFKLLDFQLDRGDRVAFVGQNGQGKSTLVKLITDKLEHDGKLTIGHNVSVGYYAQVQENTLDLNATVLETIEHAAPEEWNNVSRIRALLGAFLFGPDDIDKRVKVLSGGEKSRLALARLLLKPCNLLILDEPTNHLDIASKEVLKEALLHFNGTLIVVSHDRDFLGELTTKTYEFANKTIKEHLGDISEFLNKHEVASFRDFEQGGKPKQAKKEQPKQEDAKKDKPDQKEDYEAKKQRQRDLRKLQKDVSRIEKKIAEFEESIAKLEEQMHDPSFYSDETKNKEAMFQHAEFSRQLEEYMAQWEIAHEKLEELENN